ncbi:alpha/beta hydrolase [Methanobrevibacter sp.]
MNRKVKIAIVIIVAVIAAYSIYYLTSYSPAEQTATDCLNGTANVSVSKIDNELFVDGKGNDTALIFYPGAKIEYTAYLPMLCELSSMGVDCYLVEMPFNIALFGENEADDIIETTNYSNYILCGHSLGGVVASSYMTHSGKGDGLILLAGYPTENITKPVLSIYGSNDGDLNRKSYDEAKPLMSNLTEFVIDGGNHAQFGYYGKQSGDNAAGITPEDQQNQTVEKILDFINAVK